MEKHSKVKEGTPIRCADFPIFFFFLWLLSGKIVLNVRKTSNLPLLRFSPNFILVEVETFFFAVAFMFFFLCLGLPPLRYNEKVFGAETLFGKR